MWPLAAAPAGWLLCNGASTAAYPELAALIGPTTPDMTDRVPVAAGPKAVGSTGGSATATLVTANLPAHSHTIGGTTGGQSDNHTHGMNHNHTVNSRAGTGANANAVPRSDATAIGAFTGAVNAYTGETSGASVGHTHTLPADTGSVGAGTPVSTQDPYFAVSFIIKASP